MAEAIVEKQTEAEIGLKVIPRVSLKDKAVQRIREAIERGELQAGETLTELGLARKLGVGQPTIREALLELEFLGFIERQGPRKTRVTQLSRRAIHDIYLVRMRLETLAAELVAKKSSEEDLSEPWSAVGRMEAAAKIGDAINFYQADLGFHRALWKAAANESLQSCLEQLVPKLMTFSIIQKADPAPAKLMAIAQVHRKLLETIATGNVEETVRQMSDSMKNALEDDEQLPGLD
ncbi:MAG: GntR family transcriptional regulator [Acidobacteriaceae bacterium]|nr:GntR family transcriptional regulator [Acidobacteriaceae bacterium]